MFILSFKSSLTITYQCINKSKSINYEITMKGIKENIQDIMGKIYLYFKKTDIMP